MALLAGAGGILAIGFSIGFPIVSAMHGRPYQPAFSLFSAWGIAALAGALACLHTYRLSDEGPHRPPRGGLHVDILRERRDAAGRTLPPQTGRRAA